MIHKFFLLKFSKFIHEFTYVTFPRRTQNIGNMKDLKTVSLMSSMSIKYLGSLKND